MKAFFVGSIAIVAVAMGNVARAADLEQQPFEPRLDGVPPRSNAYDRSGFYGGVVGGGALATSDHVFIDGTMGSGDFKVRGGLFGGTVGFGYQNGPWVLAMENDLEWALANGGVRTPGGAFSTNLQWLYNYRARVGYAFDRSVPYIAFGPTFGGLQIATTIPGLGAVSNRETRSGWTLGAGWEYAFTPELAAKVEYLFICLGQSTQFSVDNVEFMGHFVRAGLNYRFDWTGGRAADAVSAAMPLKTPAGTVDYRWTGVYVGFNVGGSAGKRVTAYSLAGVPIGEEATKTNGAFRTIGFHGLAGIQAGYNWQIEHLLLGFEADFQLTQFAGRTLNSRFIAVSGGATGTLDSVVQMPLLGTMRGRLGYAADRWLFYVTGGLAYGEVQTNSTFTLPGIGSVTSASETTPMGWTAGVGVEGALWSNWSAKFEYLYFDLGRSRDNFAGTGPFGQIAANSNVTEHIVRAGLNTRFDWGGPR